MLKSGNGTRPPRLGIHPIAPRQWVRSVGAACLCGLSLRLDWGGRRGFDEFMARALSIARPGGR